MHQFIEKFYKMLFESPEPKDEVSYQHKRLAVTISIILFLVVIVMIIRDIVKNLHQIN